MKKKFIFFLGVGWCGTTSLYYTLQHKLNYMHGGWLKESQYTPRLFPDTTRMGKKYADVAHKMLFNSLSYIKESSKDDILKKFTENELNDYFGPKVSLEKYSRHYLRLAEYCGDQYQSVGDFTNKNFDLSLDMFRQINCEMTKYFDVKVIIILRDLVRQRWSYTCALSNYNQDYFIPYYDQNTDLLDNARMDPCLKYAQKIKDAYDAFGKENVHYIIMEDFFKDEKNNPEVSKLENFLNIKIPEVYPCVFVPDKGINGPKIDGLKDQWTSDHEILTQEFYNELRYREDYIKEYSEFEELHGSLPADWGAPINYGY